MSCDALPDAFLEAQLSGAIDGTLRWSSAEMRCDGMQRPDNRGLRVTFSGRRDGEALTLVFGIPVLAEGAAGQAVPVNVTLIREGGSLYGTLGDTKCVLDTVSQVPLPASAGGDSPAPTAQGAHRWRIDARGFCLEPARSITDPRDAILLATFDFRGQLTWDSDPPPTAPLTAPASPPR